MKEGLASVSTVRIQHSVVYFLQAIGGGPVKIGYTGRTVVERIKDLQPGNPQELVVRATLPGSKKDEDEWHAKFADARIRPTSEWFRVTPELQKTFPTILSENPTPRASHTPVLGPTTHTGATNALLHHCSRPPERYISLNKPPPATPTDQNDPRAHPLLTACEIAALNYLRTHREATTRAIYDHVGIPKGSDSNLMQELKRQGLVHATDNIKAHGTRMNIWKAT